MKLSVNWLKQFVVDFDNDETEQIVSKLKSSLAEVEDSYNICEKLENIVAGEITEIVDHPSKDKIKIVLVKISETKVLEILCGADNIRVGNIVPVCLVGGIVYDVKSKDSQKTVKIEEREIDGKVSQGMLCSQKELGIGEDHSGIYILPNSTAIGTNLVEILKDTVIEVENKGITNRPDCFSHVGIAREIAVQNQLPFNAPHTTHKPIQTANKALKIEVEAPLKAPRYSAIVISDVKVKESPLWLQTRLLAVGVRPINNIVDITNYIMLEIGQPSHAFDYDKISGQSLVLRESKKGESVITLDGKKRKLEAGVLVNCDADGPIGIAGIMGGQKAEISFSTTTVVIQVENFEMYNIRGSSRRLGLRTEASTRFEKGLDPYLVEDTIYRVTEMILDLAGGEVASEVYDAYPVTDPEISIDFNINKVTSFLGIEIKREEVLEILKKLGITMADESLEILTLQIPSFRRDLKIEEDILEEIIRIYGYDNVPFELPTRTTLPVRKNKRFELEQRIISALSSAGSNQVITYAFVGKELYNKATIDISDNLKLENPLSPELEYLRDTILPSLLEKISFNYNRFEEIDLFEVSKTALKQIDQETQLHVQPKFISGVVLSEHEDVYAKVKGKIEYMLKQVGINNITFTNLDGDIPFKKAKVFHPKKTALIFYKEQQIGILGFVNPRVCDNFEISTSTIAYEINFDLISELAQENVDYHLIYNLPIVERSLSFWVDETLEMDEIFSTVNKLSLPNLSEINLEDIYRDAEHPEKKSITLDIKLQSPIKTLTDEEVSFSLKQIEEALKSKLKAELRDN